MRDVVDKDSISLYLRNYQRIISHHYGTADNEKPCVGKLVNYALCISAIVRAHLSSHALTSRLVFAKVGHVGHIPLWTLRDCLIGAALYGGHHNS